MFKSTFASFMRLKASYRAALVILVLVVGIAAATYWLTVLRFVQTTYPEAVAALEEVERYLLKVRNLVGLFRSSRH